MKFYFLIKQFKLNQLTEMNTLAPKIVQGQTNVIKCNTVIFHLAQTLWSNLFHWFGLDREVVVLSGVIQEATRGDDTQAN